MRYFISGLASVGTGGVIGSRAMRRTIQAGDVKMRVGWQSSLVYSLVMVLCVSAPLVAHADSLASSDRSGLATSGAVAVEVASGEPWYCKAFPSWPGCK